MVEGYYCYINDCGRICAAEIKLDPELYERRKKTLNVFPDAKKAHAALDKIMEVLQCQQCVDSEGM